MFKRKMRRRYKRGLWHLISKAFYINPQKQYLLIVISAIAMAALAFSGLLLFRQSDHGDMLTRGKWLMKQGKVALAINEFEELVRQHKSSDEGHLELGKAYMAAGENEKAAREFRKASLLRSKNLHESGAHIAISRMMIAQGKYQDAQKQLFQAYNARPENRDDPELLSAMVDLYEDWGDSYLETEPPDYERAFLKFSSAMRYVKTYEQQKRVQDKLVSAATRLADVYDNNKEYDKAIAVLKRATRYQQTADNLQAIAAMYEQKEELDKAIYWYQKAYEVDPKVISLKLSSMLIRKAHELNEAHRPKEAEAYFARAKKINEMVKLPLDKLYPVEASNIELSYKINSDSFNLSPSIRFRITNIGAYPIDFLNTRVFFMTGEEKLAEAQQIIASSQNPLASRGNPKEDRMIKLESAVSVPLEDLEEGKLRARLMVSYTRETESRAENKWFEIKNVEVAVPEAQTGNGTKAENSM